MKHITAILALALVVSSPSAFSRDTTLMLPIEEIMNSEKYQTKLNRDVKFYFADQATPKTEKNMGNFLTSKKTNAFNKSDEEACRHVMLSALIALQNRAIKEGGNAVINIISNYKHKEYRSSTELECHAGVFVAGAALKGNVVRLAN